MRGPLFASVAVALCLGLTACGDSDDSDSNSSSAGGNAAAETTADSGAAKSSVDSSKEAIRFALTATKIPGGDLLGGMQDGAEAAAAKINSEGGFGGREAVVDSCNGMMQPAVTVVCARKAVANKATVGFGCDVSWGTGGLPVLAKAKIPSFNCPNTKEDFNNPMSFGLTPSSLGGRRGTAQWLCSRPEVKRVLLLTYDNPEQRASGLKVLNPVLKGCDKETDAVFFPLAGGDLTPYVSKALKFKPDFIIMSATGSNTVNLLRSFAQNDFPASKIALPDVGLDWDVVLDKAGSAADGVYSQAQFRSWGDAEDPDVAEYLATMKKFSKADPRNPNTQWGYLYMTYFYAAAKEIGFDKFNSETLAEFTTTNNGFSIPMSRKLVNPGPKDYPQQKQPFILIEQYKGDGKFVPVTGGDNGWFNGY